MTDSAAEITPPRILQHVCLTSIRMHSIRGGRSSRTCSGGLRRRLLDCTLFMWVCACMCIDPKTAWRGMRLQQYRGGGLLLYSLLQERGSARQCPAHHRATALATSPGSLTTPPIPRFRPPVGGGREMQTAPETHKSAAAVAFRAVPVAVGWRGAHTHTHTHIQTHFWRPLLLHPAKSSDPVELKPAEANGGESTGERAGEGALLSHCVVLWYYPRKGG